MMNSYKICVYAICKNEEQFVERWVDSMSEADSIIVLDTGSTDNTVNKLKELGVNVYKEIFNPWRFDVARNKSLELVPEDTDICVCTDLDEVFEKGWREKVENAWKENTQQLRYRYTWNFDEDGNEGYVFLYEKIHARNGFKWVHPVHEVLNYYGDQQYIVSTEPKIQLNHYPEKSKSRAQYLGLLELSVQEDPNDDRNLHYLGREYMYMEMWDKCISTLLKHLELPTALWKAERSASMRYIAKSYMEKGNISKAKEWFAKSILEEPNLREPYVDMANLLYKLQEWSGVLYMIECALKIEDRPLSYINEPGPWGSEPYDLASIACFNLQLYKKSYYYITKAVEISPSNKRLKNNLDLIKKFI